MSMMIHRPVAADGRPRTHIGVSHTEDVTDRGPSYDHIQGMEALSHLNIVRSLHTSRNKYLFLL